MEDCSLPSYCSFIIGASRFRCCDLLMPWERNHLDEILHHPDGLTTQWIVSLGPDCHGSFPLDRALALSHQYQYRKTITVLSIEVYGHTIMTTNRLASLVAVPNRHELRHRLYFCQCYHPATATVSESALWQATARDFHS